MANDEDLGLYVVTFTDASGVAQTVATPSRNDAICYFMKMSYLFAYAMEGVTLRVVGVESDQPHCGMHLIAELQDGPVEVLGLTRAMHIEPRPGWYPPDHSDKTFEELAQRMDIAVTEKRGSLEASEKVRLRESAAAVARGSALASDMLADWKRSLRLQQPVQMDAQRVWRAMSEVKQLRSLWAPE